MSDLYFKKFGFENHPLIHESVSNDLSMVVVIPCFNEPDVISSLQALENCAKPDGEVEVIIVVNCSEKADQETKDYQRKTFQDILEFNKTAELNFHPILQTELPRKHAGVGLARKIGMDEAAFRLSKSESETKLIVCFDADSNCDKNYLIEIYSQFYSNPKANGASIYFEHPLESSEQYSYEENVFEGIINYELFLRYYNLAFHYMKLPYAYHTVGSSMACTSEAYMKQGGMNKRKAGEDFYFIHKIITLGNFLEINGTRVIPSPRISDRVPFGTGKAVGDWVEEEKTVYESYPVKSFELVHTFVSNLRELYEEGLNWDLIPKEIHPFLIEQNLNQDWNGMLQNSTSFESFEKRFFTWFSAFRIMKLMHWLRDEVYPNEPLIEQVPLLLESLGHRCENKTDAKSLLSFVREIERNR